MQRLSVSEKRMKGLNILGNVWHFELTANRYSESTRRKYIYSMPPASPPKTKRLVAEVGLGRAGTFGPHLKAVMLQHIAERNTADLVGKIRDFHL